MLVEVTSKSTDEYDRGEKLEHYEQIASLREYVARAGDRALIRFLDCEIDVDGLYDAATEPSA